MVLLDLLSLHLGQRKQLHQLKHYQTHHMYWVSSLLGARNVPTHTATIKDGHGCVCLTLYETDE